MRLLVLLLVLPCPTLSCLVLPCLVLSCLAAVVVEEGSSSFLSVVETAPALAWERSALPTRGSCNARVCTSQFEGTMATIVLLLVMLVALLCRCCCYNNAKMNAIQNRQPSKRTGTRFEFADARFTRMSPF